LNANGLPWQQRKRSWKSAGRSSQSLSIKKVGQDTAIALLELAVKVKPKVAISALEKLGG